MPTTRREFVKNAAVLPLIAAAGAGLATTAQAAAPEPVRRSGGPRLKLSLNGFSFDPLFRRHLAGEAGGMSLFDVLEFCARHDFDAIDPTGYYFTGYPAAPEPAFLNDFKRRAFQLGLDISGTGVRTDFASPDKSVREASLRHAFEWIEVAARMGAPVIRVFAGAVPPGYEQRWDEVAAWMIEPLAACAEHGKKAGVVVGVQNHGDMLQTADQTLYVVNQVASDWFGVIVDTGSFATTPDPYAEIERVIPWAVNWQVKESPFGKDSPVRTDLPRLMRLITAGGYRGYVPIETLAPTGSDYDPRVVVPAFAREVRAAMRAAG